MNDLVLWILTLAPVTAFVIALLAYSMRRNVKVGAMEYLIMQSATSGEVRAFGPGMHIPGPEWKELKRLPTSIQESREDNEPVAVKGGVEMLLSYRINFVIGRPTVDVGTEEEPFLDFASNPLDTSKVLPDEMCKAATKLDPAHMNDQVSEGLDYAFEQVFRLLTDDQLQDPENHPVELPTRKVPGMKRDPKSITDAQQMLDILGEQLRRTANAKLLPLGYGLTDVSIFNIKHASEALQKARTRARELELQADAVKRAMKKLPDGGVSLDAEMMILFGNPEAFAAGMQAQAWKKLAESLPNLHDIIHVENH